MNILRDIFEYALALVISAALLAPAWIIVHSLAPNWYGEWMTGPVSRWLIDLVLG